MKSGKRELVITKKTSFIVIGPMEREEEGVTSKEIKMCLKIEI